MRKITLKQVAERAGVGIATVDRVLNQRGGVRPSTARKVLIAAQQANLPRHLPEEGHITWQIELFLSNVQTWFFNQLSREFSKIATQLGYRRIKLYRSFIDESQPEVLAQQLRRSCQTRDGIILFGHNYPEIHEALQFCAQQGLPVISLASDLPQAARLCHVGIDQYQSGRTAGFLLSQRCRQAGEVIMISGNYEFSAHQQRISGFRSAIADYAPWLILRELIVGNDEQEKIIQGLERELTQADSLVGIYNSGDNNHKVSKLLKIAGLAGKLCYITHELYSLTRYLLRDMTITYVLDQNIQPHASLALQLMLNHLEQGYQPSIYDDGNVDLKIFTAENLPKHPVLG